MNKEFVKYLPIGDIHLGHKNNPTHKKIASLDTFFFQDYVEEVKDIDVLILMGDEFDRLISNGTEEFIMIMKWFAKLFLFCSRNDIMVRIIEGTESHSYKQMKVIKELVNEYRIDLDIRYFETIYIEYIEKLDITFLYVPDEINDDAEITYNEIKKIMKDKNISQVDCAFFHGQFHFQLPMTHSIHSHTESNYLPLVKYFISTGHIHTPMIFDRIVGEGSFERDTHGQEEPKGAFIFTIAKIGIAKSSYRFIENRHAMTFVTFEIETEDITELYSIIEVKSKKLRQGSFIRLHMSENNPLFRLKRNIYKDFPRFNIKIEDNSKDKKKKNRSENLITNGVTELLHITPLNIKTLIDENLVIYNLNEEESKIKDIMLSKIL